MAQRENMTADAQFMMGQDAVMNIDGKGSLVHEFQDDKSRLPTTEPINRPTEEERHTLRRVAGKLPMVVYFICAVEFAERASYYGVQPLISNFVNRRLPKGGNGWGAPPRGDQQTAGALGMGTVKASAVSQSFSMLAYTLPVFFGYIADTRTGRFRLICYGVFVFGIAHILMVVSGSKSLLANGNAKIPYFISVYVLAIGAAMFKPCVSPILLDQMRETEPVTKVLKSGEKVIIDPEATTERVMLWFYLLINVGGFMNVPTAYTAKYVGWWLSFLIPLILYLPLLPLLWWLKPKLVLHPPGGSDLVNVFKILGICFRRGGIKKLFKRNGGFFESAKPSVIAQSGRHIDVPWNDEFVVDVRRAFLATGIFCFFPFQSINDNGLGGAANALSTMLITNGVPNDVISNFNSLSIIFMAPVLNYGLYPMLRRYNIHYGPMARIFTGLMLAVVGGIGYTVLNYYAYKLGPCGHYGSSGYCADNGLVANISIWFMAIPYALGGISELFVNVPAYGLAYSMAPKNMRGLVAALNLFSQAITYALGLAFSGLIKDPYITWDFGGPAIAGFVAACFFYWMYRDLDKLEYTLTKNGDYQLRLHNDDPTSSDNGASTADNQESSKETGVALNEKSTEKELL